jgi:hypothetical protein
MTDQIGAGPEVYTSEMLARDLAEREQQEKVEKAQAALERLVDDAYQAFVAENDREPSEDELRALVASYQAERTRERMAANKVAASRQIRSQF